MNSKNSALMIALISFGQMALAAHSALLASPRVNARYVQSQTKIAKAVGVFQFTSALFHGADLARTRVILVAGAEEDANLQASVTAAAVALLESDRTANLTTAETDGKTGVKTAETYKPNLINSQQPETARKYLEVSLPPGIAPNVERRTCGGVTSLVPYGSQHEGTHAYRATCSNGRGYVLVQSDRTGRTRVLNIGSVK